MLRTRRTKAVGIICAAAVIGSIVWWLVATVGGSAEREAARRAAAEFLGAEIENVQLMWTALTTRHYTYDVYQNGRRSARLRVDRDPVWVASGEFRVLRSERADSRSGKGGALRVAREFAEEHFPDFSPLGLPAVFKKLGSVWPTWDIQWEIHRSGEPFRWLAVSVDATSGQLLGFRARQEEGRTPIPPSIDREAALQIAKRGLPDWAVIHRVEARLSRSYAERPLGHPVWDVRLYYGYEVDCGGEGFYYTEVAHLALIDGLTGEVTQRSSREE